MNADELGFAIENDYTWPRMRLHGGGDCYFGGDTSQLHTVHIKRVDEHYGVNLEAICMSPELRDRVHAINLLADKANVAIIRGDIQRLRACYSEFSNLRRGVPYNAEKLVHSWKVRGLI